MTEEAGLRRDETWIMAAAEDVHWQLHRVDAVQTGNCPCADRTSHIAVIISEHYRQFREQLANELTGGQR